MADDELDYEDDIEDEQEFYCAICSECFDTGEEFVDHTNSAAHTEVTKNKIDLLKENDAYCSLCLVSVPGQFDEHCKSSDHVEFVAATQRGFPGAKDPTLLSIKKSRRSTSAANKAGTLRERIFSQKCIGISHIRRQENRWFCDLCLDKFNDSVDDHCTRAGHAIQCVKLFEPETAYNLKVYALQSHLNKKFKSLMLTKAKEIFEIEKETPEFLRFMLLIDRLEKTVVKSEKSASNQTALKDDDMDESNILRPSNPDSSEQDLESAEALLETDESPDTNEFLCLFEEGDRDVIPGLDDSVVCPPAQIAPQTSVKLRLGQRSEKNTDVKRMAAKDTSMIIGIAHIKFKARIYQCLLCNVTCKTTLSSCKNHMVSSLHRRRVIIQNFCHPVPDYLEKLRTQDALLYSSLIRLESRKIEAHERKNESAGNIETRAGILDVHIKSLPVPLLSEKAMSAKERSINVVELAEKWEAENNILSPVNTSDIVNNNTGANKSVISPIQPRKENLLVGINAITIMPSNTFFCKLCNIKFSIQAKRKQKSHVTGRLHKLKALSGAYGKDVEDYFTHRMTKEGYEIVMGIINKSCILLEKEEIESESQTMREVRAKILGVKVEQLPLPLIIMSTEEPFDVKQAALEWKAGKKPAKISVTIHKQDSKSPDTENTFGTRKDHQSFGPIIDEGPAPADIHIEVKNDKAKNIFDLCKPLPSTTPEKKTFPSKKSNIKNIDIDTLRKSLVDADFIPLKKDANDDKPSTHQTTSGDTTPKSSKSVVPPVKKQISQDKKSTVVGVSPKLQNRPSNVINKSNVQSDSTYKNVQNTNEKNSGTSARQLPKSFIRFSNRGTTKTVPDVRGQQRNSNSDSNQRNNFKPSSDSEKGNPRVRGSGRRDSFSNNFSNRQTDMRFYQSDSPQNRVVRPDGMTQDRHCVRGHDQGQEFNGRNLGSDRGGSFNNKDMTEDRVSHYQSNAYQNHPNNNPNPITQNLDIDMDAMKNINLSSVLARVTNLQSINHNNSQHQNKPGPVGNNNYNNYQERNSFQSHNSYDRDRNDLQRSNDFRDRNDLQRSNDFRDRNDLQRSNDFRDRNDVQSRNDYQDHNRGGNSGLQSDFSPDRYGSSRTNLQQGGNISHQSSNYSPSQMSMSQDQQPRNNYAGASSYQSLENYANDYRQPYQDNRGDFRKESYNQGDRYAEQKGNIDYSGRQGNSNDFDSCQRYTNDYNDHLNTNYSGRPGNDYNQTQQNQYRDYTSPSKVGDKRGGNYQGGVGDNKRYRQFA